MQGHSTHDKLMRSHGLVKSDGSLPTPCIFLFHASLVCKVSCTVSVQLAGDKLPLDKVQTVSWFCEQRLPVVDKPAGCPLLRVVRLSSGHAEFHESRKSGTSKCVTLCHSAFLQVPCPSTSRGKPPRLSHYHHLPPTPLQAQPHSPMRSKPCSSPCNDSTPACWRRDWQQPASCRPATATRQPLQPHQHSRRCPPEARNGVGRASSSSDALRRGRCREAGSLIRVCCRTGCVSRSSGWMRSLLR